MSENITENRPERECRICGHNGYLGDVCPQCKRPLDQERQYTLSELRAMDHDKRERIVNKGRPSGSPPRIVKLPGSA